IAPNFKVKVLEEATCSICLEYLTEPVTIDCGHNFCRVCITQYSEQREPESDTKFPCPQCRVLFQKQKLQPNMQLADIVENIKKLRPKLLTVLQMTSHQLDVTLDPDTAHPNLVLYEDRKCVRHGDTRQDLPDNPERFDCCHCVLGTEGFTGGRCYWEVEVGDMTDWMLGVCRESVSRKGWVILTTENGYWAMWLWDGEYKVLTSPRTSLPVSVRPSRVGIFLDYEAGEVSFYNVTDRSHLFTFTGTFSGTLRPYFCPGLNSGGKNAAPLIICPVPAQAPPGQFP
uniref:Uncharacterized protein n=1 Tax=Chelydra serpentina TaxID=8475 RepID=A0A8C3S721_CHESE